MGWLMAFLLHKKLNLLNHSLLHKLNLRTSFFGLGQGMEVTHVNPDIVSLRKRQSW